jgi:DNA-binding transcriptional regulator YhcF (GntR family)
MRFEPGKTKMVQVADHMRGRIATGEWDVGQPLPGLTDLEVEYGVSFGTVRAAQQILVEEGLLSEPEQGISTRVIARPAAPDSHDAAAKARLAYRALGKQLERLVATAERGGNTDALDLRRLGNHQVHNYARHVAAAAALASGYRSVRLDGPNTRVVVEDRTVQVNSRRQPGSPWQFSINRVVVEDAVAVILVDLTGDYPDFYIVPAQRVSDLVKRRYEQWLESKGGTRPRNPASDHATLEVDAISEWHRRWDVLTAADGAA